MSQDYILWNEIQIYLNNLSNPINNSEITKFLKNISDKLRCEKCKNHFNNFKRPAEFKNKEDFSKWILNYKKNIQKSKPKYIKKFISNKYNNRIVKTR